MYQHLSTSPTLKKLHLIGPHVIGADLFAKMPCFPVLAEFHLEFAADMADGRWFFVKDLLSYGDLEEEEELEYWFDPETGIEEWVVRPIITLEDSDDEDGSFEQRHDKFNRYRTLPNPEVIPEFLSDAARFVQTSSRLQKFCLGVDKPDYTIWNEPSMNRVLEVCFLRRGTTKSDPRYPPWIQIPAEQKILDWDRLYWRVGDKWRPDNTVMQAWKNATGPGTKVLFLDEKHWTGQKPHAVYQGDLEKELLSV